MVILAAKFPVDLAEQVRARAEAEDRSVSSLIRRAVRRDLAELTVAPSDGEPLEVDRG
jgi:hypothetical protein